MPTRPDKAFDPTQMQLRLLQTTDLHMQLIPYNYEDRAPAPNRSLVHLREDIARLRGAGIATLLCDTGDFLQGNASADLAMAGPRPHPMISAFNDLRYDAIVLGNHDFDYGIAQLRCVLADLTCPYLAANVGLDDGRTVARDFVILPVQVNDGDSDLTLRVGLLGLTTPNIGLVSLPDDADQLVTQDPVTVAHSAVPRMKAQGADIVVALCHFGVDAHDTDENVAHLIAAVPGIDAVLAGHMHDVFPGPDIAPSAGIDPVAGTLHGKPAVMAGAFGLHIGVVDLTLSHDGDRWEITHGQSRIVTPAANPVPPPLSSPGLLALHEETLTHLDTPVAQTEVPLSTAFSLIEPDMAQQLLAESRIARIRDQLSDQVIADRPILGSAAPYRVGNKHAPLSYMRVAPGPITLHDVHSIYPFRDPVVGLAQTGAQIRAWLERAAGLFNTITPNETDQALINPGFPPYFFTTIHGLTYDFDLCRPVGDRVRNLRFGQTPVDDSDGFIVATTPHLKRAHRGAGDTDTLTVTSDTSQEILVSYLQDLGTVRHANAPVWGFRPVAGARANFTTHVSATAKDTRRHVAALGMAPSGLRRFTLHFT